MSVRAYLLAIVPFVLLCGCKPPAPPASLQPTPTPPRPSGGDVGDLPERNTRFAFALFDRLHAEKPDENLFISPLSVSTALAMVYYGAAGETARAIAKTMQWGGLSPQRVNERLKDLKASLRGADPEVQLAIADSMWMEQKVSFKPEFVAAISGIPGVKIDRLDLTNPRSADTINGWVRAETGGLIPDITSARELTEREIWLVLLDAVYFKARWSQVFSRSETNQAPFHLLNGRTKLVPMMSQHSYFNYLATDQFQAIRLPYGKTSALAMYVFLPSSQTGLDGFLAVLTPKSWRAWARRLEFGPGTIALPRFTARTSEKLNDVLSALGMAVAFDRDTADFSAMSDASMCVDFVRQKSYVKVDEEGTEAAAVLGVPMPGGGGPTGPFVMTVDRPFFLVIEDKHTHTILFMGAIVEPEE